MKVTLDLEEENDSLTVGELRKRYQKREEDQTKKADSVIEKYKGKYFKVPGKWGESFDYYHIRELKQRSCYDDFSPLFKAEVESVCLSVIASIRERKEDFSEKVLREATEINKEKFEKAKSIVSNYLKEVEEYEKTV